MVAITTIPAVPTDPDPLTTFPWLHTLAQGIHNSNHFMSWHARILNAGPESFFN
jgi:hypothetical protein